MDANRTCGRCEGKGASAYDYNNSVCYQCGGHGFRQAPNLDGIRLACKGRKGLRSARPKEARAYYVWRMARFHGGKDTTLPIMASVELGSDPFAKELDALADELAKQYFGSNLTGAARWGRALGYL